MQIAVYLDGDIGQVVREDGLEDVVVHAFGLSDLWPNIWCLSLNLPSENTTVPPLAQLANAEAIAGESSSVPPEEVYLEGIVHVLPTVEFWARAAEAPRPMERSKEIMFEETERIRSRETLL